jgi:protein involved in temperature-dependent protein secretion
VVDADSFLKAGDLAQAKIEILANVKRAPQDQKARMYLFQLLLITGDWDKAEVHLRALSQLSPEAQMLATVYSGLILAEKSRANAFNGKTETPVLIGGSPWADGVAASIRQRGLGHFEEATRLLSEALDLAEETKGSFNDTSFEWIADVDGRLGPTFEAVLGGQWGLIPFEAVQLIKCDGPQNLRDLVWLPAEFRFRTGQSGAGFLPARYFGSEASEDPEVQLGRTTIFSPDATGEEVPLGQKMFWTGEGDDLPIFDLRTLSMD